MASASFKNFVGPKTVRVKEVRNGANKTRCSERSDNSCLSTKPWPDLPKSQNTPNRNLHMNTSSWPELPKSQNMPNHNLKMWSTAERISGTRKNELSTCETDNGAVKTTKGHSWSRTIQGKQVVEMSPCSAGIQTEPVDTHDNRNTFDDEAKGGTFYQGLQRSSSDSKHSTSKSTMDGRKRQQAKRSILKEEKKRLREAEILSKRVEPKGQKVRVISHKILEMVLKSDKHSISVNSQKKCEVAAPNFPTLEEATKKSKNKFVNDRAPQSADNEKSRVSGSNPIVSTVTSRRNKHKEPLEIDIHNLIKDSSRKSSDKSWKSSKEPNLHMKGKKEVVPYIGNQLDSANPVRKRGKQRERPKKRRFTLLKMAILEARALRKHLCEVEEQSKIASSLPEINICKEGVIELNDINKAVNCDNKENENLNKISCTNAEETDIDASELPSHHSSATAKPSSVNSSDTATAKEGDVDQSSKISTKKFPHSRKFREYCDHMLTEDLNNAVRSLIENLLKFQDRLYQRDPIKAFAKRRYVAGFREVKKYLLLKRLKLVIIAPDLEVAKNEGGLDNAVTELKDMTKLQCVPYAFAMNRRALGHITLKKVGISCIGIVNYEGSEDNFKAIMEALPVARMQYNKITNKEVAVTSQKEGPEETRNNTAISDCIAASILDKLRDKSLESEMQCKQNINPFLAAIEKRVSEDLSD